jgi:mono/diheme cytochrome c family protein
MRTATVIKTAIALVLVSSALLVGYAYSGLYDVAASGPDNAAMRWLLVTVRNRSIDHRAARIEVPSLTDPGLVEEGFEHYHEMCVGCHLAPGVDSSEIRLGLNPQPPVLTQVVPHSSPARLFWVVKNGVKMSGMPAWGTSHSDQMIWAIVAFLEQMPNMTPAQYQAMEKKLDSMPGHDDDMPAKR